MKYLYNPVFAIASVILFLVFPVLLMLDPTGNGWLMSLGECCLVIVIAMYAYTTCHTKIFATHTDDNITIDKNQMLISMYCNYLVMIGKIFVYVVLFHLAFKIVIHVIHAHTFMEDCGFHQGRSFAEMMIGDPDWTVAKLIGQLIAIYKIFQILSNLFRIANYKLGILISARNLRTEIKNSEAFKADLETQDPIVRELTFLQKPIVEKFFIEQADAIYNQWLENMEIRLEGMKMFGLFEMSNIETWSTHLVSLGMGAVGVLIYYIYVFLGDRAAAAAADADAADADATDVAAPNAHTMDETTIKTRIARANKIGFTIILSCYLFFIVMHQILSKQTP